MPSLYLLARDRFYMVKQALQLSAVALALASLTGCQQLGIEFSNEPVQYESSTSRAPLEIPPDLSAIPPCEGVKYFSARCCGLSVNVTTLCTLFPHPETMILDTRGQDDVDNCLECLMRMKSLRRLELSCHGHKGPMRKDMLREFLKSLPQLERCKLSVWCNLGPLERGERRGSKYHAFELSDSIENNSAGVVEVPDLGEYTDVTLRLYSPTIRFIEFRPSSVKGSAVPEGLKSMTLSLHNVIPSGEESLIDSGELRYSIHIDRSR